MKRVLLLSVFLLISFCQYGQTLSKTKIIYQHKSDIILNDGNAYEIVKESYPFELNQNHATDNFNLQIDKHKLYINKVILLKTKSKKNKYVELIEWTKDKMIFYQRRSVANPTQITSM